MGRLVRKETSTLKIRRVRREVDAKHSSTELTPWYKRFPLWRTLEVAGIGVAIWALLVTVEANQLTLIALKETQKQTELTQKANELATEELEQTRIVNAWQIMTTKASGNSGKKEALETLHKAGQSLRGIDLSCENMGGIEVKDSNAKVSIICKRPSYLHGAQLEKAQLPEANLSEVILWEAKLNGANLWKTNLSGTKLWKANLSKANLKFADLSKAFFWSVDLRGADFLQANLSWTSFCSGHFGCAKNLRQDQINKAWAWADRSPIFSDGKHKLDLKNTPLCDPKLRPQYEANKQTGKPHEC